MQNNLQKIRKIKKVTQKQLAEYLGVSKAMISMWENNLNEKIPPDRVKQIAEFLKVEENDILTPTLAIKELEKNTLKDEVYSLAAMYSESYEEEILERIKQKMDIEAEIEEEIQYMHQDEDKLKTLRLTAKILNDEEIEADLNKIKPAGMGRSINDFLLVLKSKNIQKYEVVSTLLELLNNPDDPKNPFRKLEQEIEKDFDNLIKALKDLLNIK